MIAAEKRASNEELRRKLLELPEGVTGEVIDGVLYTMGRARPAHQFASAQIVGDLGTGRYGGAPPPAGWLILQDIEILFPTSESAAPDIVGWRLERIPPGREQDNPMTVVPDWVCEILSESTRVKDLGSKRDLYARHGVQHLWMVDADARVVEAFALNERRRWELLGSFSANAVMATAPFEGTPLRIEKWWLEPRLG